MKKSAAGARRIEKRLTPPTLLEMGILRQSAKSAS